MNQPNTVPLQPSDLRGLSRLAIDGVVGVTDLVEHLHASISAPYRRSPQRAHGLTGAIYGSVRGITRLVGGSIDLALAPLGSGVDDPSSTRRIDVQSVLNGVLGDYLADTNNPLAIELDLLHQGKSILRESRMPEVDSASRQVVLFIHGLCLHPGRWGAELSESLPARLAQRADCTILHLHYNTGRAIDANGRALANVLDEMIKRWPVDVEQITLIGHSMGGLVARSAAHHAQSAGHQWAGRLQRIVTLGTPHLGAPLERAGHRVDQLFGISRYSRPFARLSALRSAGITDLRWGITGNRLINDPLPAGATLHLVAGSRSEAGSRVESGDGLVPVESALAAGQWRCSQRVDRIRFHECSHLELMRHPAVIDYVDRALAD